MRTVFILPVLILGACVAPAATPETPSQGGRDSCRAADYAWLVGRDRSEIPAAPEGAAWRVLCDSCAATMDYNPHRLNIVYGTETNVVQSLSCG